MKEVEEDGIIWEEYEISKEAVALVSNLRRQKDLLIAQLNIVDFQLQNMARVIVQSLVGDDVAIPEGIVIRTDYENLKVKVEKFDRNITPISLGRVPIGRIPVRPPTESKQKQEEKRDEGKKLHAESKGPVGPEL